MAIRQAFMDAYVVHLPPLPEPGCWGRERPCQQHKVGLLTHGEAAPAPPASESGMHVPQTRHLSSCAAQGHGGVHCRTRHGQQVSGSGDTVQQLAATNGVGAHLLLGTERTPGRAARCPRAGSPRAAPGCRAPSCSGPRTRAPPAGTGWCNPCRVLRMLQQGSGFTGFFGAHRSRHRSASPDHEPTLQATVSQAQRPSTRRTEALRCTEHRLRDYRINYRNSRPCRAWRLQCGAPEGGRARLQPQ